MQCIIAECVREAGTKQLCGAHYYQQWKYGDAEQADKRRKARQVECEVKECGYEGKLILGYCKKHYQRFKKYGDATTLVQKQTRGHILERLGKSFEYSPYCWNWIGHTSKGYGVIQYEGKQRAAHRLMYFLFVGGIPESMEIDHKCNNSACVNPQHLRIASREENSQNFKGARADSSTGYRGVYYLPKKGTFMAKANYKGKQYTNGTTHKSVEEANVAAIDLRNRLYSHNFWDKVK